MSEPNRRVFLVGAAGVGALGLAAAATPASAADITGLPGAKASHPHYSLKFFRKGLHKTWKVGPMRLRLESLQPIVTVDGKRRLHESAFNAVFDLVGGKHAGHGTFKAVAPNGATFPLYVSRVHHHKPGETRYHAVINRFGQES